VGTGINAAKDFLFFFAIRLPELTAKEFIPAKNIFTAILFVVN
jgi:fumarate hydratase class II